MLRMFGEQMRWTCLAHVLDMCCVVFETRLGRVWSMCEQCLERDWDMLGRCVGYALEDALDMF